MSRRTNSSHDDFKETGGKQVVYVASGHDKVFNTIYLCV